jgi:hypothetical protein
VDDRTAEVNCSTFLTSPNQKRFPGETRILRFANPITVQMPCHSPRMNEESYSVTRKNTVATFATKVDFVTIPHCDDQREICAGHCSTSMDA